MHVCAHLLCCCSDYYRDYYGGGGGGYGGYGGYDSRGYGGGYDSRGSGYERRCELAHGHPLHCSAFMSRPPASRAIIQL
jgi:hypothetical protein